MERHAIQQDLPGRRWLGAEDGSGDLGAAAAHQPEQPDDFAACQGKGQVPEFTLTGQVFDRQDLAFGLGGTVWIELLQGAPDHHPDQLALIRFARVHGTHHLSIPEHGDSIGNLKDLIKPVGDIDDERGFLLELLDEGEEKL